MNVCRIASAAATKELDALCLRFFGKALERASRELDSFHFVRELRQTSKARSRVSSLERRRLRGNRNADLLTHLPRLARSPRVSARRNTGLTSDGKSWWLRSASCMPDCTRSQSASLPDERR